MKRARKLLPIAIAAALAVAAPAALATGGSVAHLSGTLSVKKPDGSIRILSRKSEVHNGDTLNTERDSYAQIRFPDGAQVTMKPHTSIHLENIRFAEEKPQEDSFIYGLLKGGLRAVTGLVGKRNKDKYQVNTATATVGIRGTTFAADDCVSTRDGECRRLDPAVYVTVSDGEVVLKNAQGEVGIAAGQFGLIAPNQRPLFLSTDPGLQFTPPATFIQSVMAGSAVNTGKNLECVVRK
jgi:hypothetical protein